VILNGLQCLGESREYLFAITNRFFPLFPNKNFNQQPTKTGKPGEAKMQFSMLEAVSSQPSVFDYARQPPVAIALLCKILVDLGHEARGFSPQLTPCEDWDWGYIGNSNAVGITFMTLAAEEGYELGRRCKELGTKVIMGGPHASFLPDEALGNGADFVVRKEGFQTLPELVEALEQGMTDFSHILGLSWKDANGRHIHNADRPFSTQEEFEKLPIPDIKLLDGYGNATSIAVYTQVGCTDRCEFCSVVRMCENIKYRLIGSVLDEVEQLCRIYGPGVEIFFCSDNFFAKRRQAKELLRGIIERKLVIKGGLQMRIDTICNRNMVIDRQLLDLIYEAGIRAIYLGLESPNQKTLDAYNKRLTVKQIEVGVRALVEKGFHIHGMFALGGDHDDESVFKKVVKFCRKIKIHTVQFLDLMPLPGTPLTDRLEEEGRIISRKWSTYNGNFAVIIPKKMSSYRLQMGSLWASAKFYSYGWTAWLMFLSLPKASWFFIRYHRLRVNMLKAFIALLAKKKNILAIINHRLPLDVRSKIYRPIIIPVIRIWARNQVGKVKAQIRSHKKFLHTNYA
jgi:radical SAM superfamily enzyme YgiQ (UPF0313 family)